MKKHIFCLLFIAFLVSGRVLACPGAPHVSDRPVKPGQNDGKGSVEKSKPQSAQKAAVNGDDGTSPPSKEP